MRGPYRDVGKSFEEANVTHNKNMDDVWKDMQAINGESKKTVASANEAKTEAMYAKSVATKAETKVGRLESQFNEVIADGDSNAEVAASRIAMDGESKGSLPARLTSDIGALSEGLLGKASIEQLESPGFYDGIKVTKKYDGTSQSTYYLTEIPNKDASGDLIPLKRGFSKDSPTSGSPESVRSYAVRNDATVAFNASVFNVNTNRFYGIQIFNGQIVSDGVHPWRWSLGIKENNELVAYEPTTLAAEILADGCQNAMVGFIPLIQDSKPVPDYIKNSYTATNLKYTRQVIAQKNNNDLIVLTCDGVVLDSKGMTSDDLIRVLSDLGGVKFAFMLDGGGSTQTVVRNQLINQVTDDSARTERMLLDFLYVGKEDVDIRNRQDFKLAEDIGSLSKKVADDYVKATEVASDIHARIDMFGLFLRNATVVQSLDSIAVSGPYWVTPSATGNPTGDASFGVLHINYDAQNALQIGFSFQNAIKLRGRRKSNGSWIAWGPLV